MIKTVISAMSAAMMSAAFVALGIAIAAVGTQPGPGPQLIDGTWANGVAAGQNATYVYGITAAGTTQATSTQLAVGYKLMQVDTTAASTGVALPPCLQGTQVYLYNNGASTLTVYPSILNNPITAAQDTINSGTSLSGGIATHVSGIFFCAKNGIWAAK